MCKRWIPEYRWIGEAELRLAELVKENPQLYDKKQKEWLKVTTKNSLWDRVGEQLEPPATGPQCKKYYENMRTRVGKIMKERKNGAGQPQRSARDDQIMETCSFLMQHIVRGETVVSEQFAVPESAAVQERPRSPTTKTDTTTADTGVTRSDFSDAVQLVRILTSTCRLYPVCSIALGMTCTICVANQIKNHYTRRITPKRVTSGGAHLRDLAPRLHSSEETSQRWRANCANLTGPGIEPQTSRTGSVRLVTELTGQF